MELTCIIKTFIEYFNINLGGQNPLGGPGAISPRIYIFLSYVMLTEEPDADQGISES